MKTKIVKTMMAFALGMGVSLSSVSVSASTPLEQACESFAQACASGEAFACERYRRIC